MPLQLPRTSTLSRPRGFTLVELLVVIAIIAILAGLLLPVLAQAKAKAQTVVCLNNFKQLQLAWYLYADDHNDRIPPNYFETDAGKYPGTASWVSGWMTYETASYDAPWYSDSTNTLKLVPGGYGSIGNYTKSPGIYWCPADKSWIQIGGQRHPRVRSVSMNEYMNSLAAGDDAYWYVFRKLSHIVDPSPSKAFVFADEHEDSVNDGMFDVAMGNIWPDTWWLELPGGRHNSGAVFVFADGHAEVKKWRDPRTRVPVKREVHWFDHQSPQNKDVLWVQERATSKKPGAP